MNIEAATSLIRDRPRLHRYGGGLKVGGLTKAIADRLVTAVQATDQPVVIETGAGLSTLLFCCLEPLRLTSIAPDPALWDRIVGEAEERSISIEQLRRICDRSDLALPPLAAAGESVNVAFVDGDHGWPSVFVDFCYINMMLEEGGLLFLDDAHLHSVRELVLLLLHQPGFRWEGQTSKMAVFRKTSSDRFMPPGPAEQPFIRLNSVAGTGGRQK
jgi:hypothetical protein